MSGWLDWRLIDRRGNEVRGGQQSNLILDQGLDEIAVTQIKGQRGTQQTWPTYFPLIRYAAVGTNSASPDAAQTGLGAEVGRTDTTYATETLERVSPGVYRLTRFIEFGYEEANGVLTEWGFSSSSSVGSNLFNRELFRDDEGDPDAVTKTSEYKLRLAYTLEVNLSPVAFTAGSFTVEGVGVVNGDYALIGAPAPESAATRCAAPDLVAFSALARTVAVSGTGALTADDDAATGIVYVDDVGALPSVQRASIVTPRDVYAPGSFQRTGGAWRFDTPDANGFGILAFYIMGAAEQTSELGARCDRQGYVFAVDVGDSFTKDDEHALIIGAPTVTWGRA